MIGVSNHHLLPLLARTFTAVSDAKSPHRHWYQSRWSLHHATFSTSIFVILTLVATMGVILVSPWCPRAQRGSHAVHLDKSITYTCKRAPRPPKLKHSRRTSRCGRRPTDSCALGFRLSAVIVTIHVTGSAICWCVDLQPLLYLQER